MKRNKRTLQQLRGSMPKLAKAFDSAKGSPFMKNLGLKAANRRKDGPSDLNRRDRARSPKPKAERPDTPEMNFGGVQRNKIYNLDRGEQVLGKGFFNRKKRRKGYEGL